jgi:hypothetical protein
MADLIAIDAARKCLADAGSPCGAAWVGAGQIFTQVNGAATPLRCTCCLPLAPGSGLGSAAAPVARIRNDAARGANSHQGQMADAVAEGPAGSRRAGDRERRHCRGCRCAGGRRSTEIPEGIIFPGFLKPHNRTINVSGNVSGNVLATSLAMIAKARAAVAQLWQDAKRRGHFAGAESAGAEGRVNGIDA